MSQIPTSGPAPIPVTPTGLPPLPPNHPQPGDQLDPAFDHTHWRRLNDVQIGVDVVDPDGHNIGHVQTNRTFLGFDTGGWSPVDGRKHVLVGKLDRYHFYDGSGDEKDINLDIIPDRMYEFLLDDVVEKMRHEEPFPPTGLASLIERQDGKGFVVEAEITPDEEYFNNTWFPAREGRTSPLTGHRIGVYGAYVRDWSHRGRPEIHPSEVVWFRNRDVKALAGPARQRHVRWTVVVMQDDSDRFSRLDDFEIDLGNIPATWPRPWAAWPRRARVTFALLGLRGEHVTYNLRMEDGHRVAAWPGEDTRSVTVTDLDSAVTVTKLHSRRAEFKVRLGRLRQDPDDASQLHCFMSLDVQVGEGDQGQEGFAEMSLEAFGPGFEPGTAGRG
jgi:hypothetical protein